MSLILDYHRVNGERRDALFVGSDALGPRPKVRGLQLD
jgi:hypothetical protein